MKAPWTTVDVKPRLPDVGCRAPESIIHYKVRNSLQYGFRCLCIWDQVFPFACDQTGVHVTRIERTVPKKKV